MKRLLYSIIAGISIFLVIKIITKQLELNTNNHFEIEKIKLSGEFQKKLNKSINDNNLEIKILNGEIENADNMIISTDNLISYKGFIFPQKTFLHQLSDLKEVNYFEKEQYEIDELKNLIEKLIFINIENTDKTKLQNIQLPLDENIKKTFYVQCLFQTKILNKTCNHYTKNFIDYFFIYKLENDYIGLLEIFEKLKDSKYNKDFCEGIKKYSIYSKDNSENIKNLLNKCGEDYFIFFQDYEGFLEIQKQLNKGYINSLIYTNKDLNSYKLVSFLQIIYNDIQQDIIDPIRIESYGNFLKEIIKNPNYIDPIYMDIVFGFNKYYLLENLNDHKYKVVESKKNQIENMIKIINNIQNGSKLDNLVGLKELIINKELDRTTNNLKENILLSSEQSLALENLKSLSFLKILNEKKLENGISINGYFNIQNGKDIFVIYVWFMVDRDGNIIDINIGEYPDLNETVKYIIFQKKTNISEIYQYIKDNIILYLSTDIASTCDLIQNKMEYLQKNNTKVFLQLENCNSYMIEIAKQEENEYNIKEKTEYKFYMDNFTINSIKISNKMLESEINKHIGNIKSNHISIPNIIQEIVLYKVEDKLVKQEGSNNIITTIEDFDKFLNIKIDNIFENNSDIIIEFKIKDIKLIGHYNITTKELNQLSFKYNPENDKDSDNNMTQKDLKINNLNLFLKEGNNEINKFILNPLHYISNKDIETLKKYQSLKYK